MNTHCPSPVWWITGCSRGLGRAIAEAALEAGCRVAVSARDVATLADFARFPEALPVRVEVTDPASVEAAHAAILARWGAPDVLVNNAGSGLLGAVEECDAADARRMFEVNYHGPMHLIRTVLPAMRERRAGHIVNIGAAAAVVNYPGFAAYGASKAAMELASDALRREVTPLGVKVTVVHPGPFRTGFVGGSLARANRTLTDYDKTCGRFARTLAALDGKQPGDPRRAAGIIVNAVLSGAAPELLPLGAYMVSKYKVRAGELLRAADELGAQAAGADFPGAPVTPRA